MKYCPKCNKNDLIIVLIWDDKERLYEACRGVLMDPSERDACDYEIETSREEINFDDYTTIRDFR